MTDTQTNGHRSHEGVDTPMNRRLFEGLIDEHMHALKGDAEAYRALTNVLRDAMGTKNPRAFVDAVAQLVDAALRLPADVVPDAITNVRKDHGLTIGTAKKQGKGK